MREPAEWPARVDADLIDQDDHALTMSQTRKPVTTVDWREARAANAAACAAVYQTALDALADLEQCESDNPKLQAELIPFVGLLRMCHRDLTRQAERLGTQ